MNKKGREQLWLRIMKCFQRNRNEPASNSKGYYNFEFGELVEQGDFQWIVDKLTNGYKKWYAADTELWVFPLPMQNKQDRDKGSNYTADTGKRSMVNIIGYFDYNGVWQNMHIRIQQQTEEQIRLSEQLANTQEEIDRGEHGSFELVKGR